MQTITLGNRPAALAPRTRIVDFQADSGLRARVSLKLREGVDADKLMIDAQAFEVDANGVNVIAPDGRPSRTPSTEQMVLASSLGDTHTLNPGWVRIVGDYDETTFDATATRAAGKPTAEPDWQTNPNGQHYDTATGIGYRWSEGETMRIAKGKVDELANIVNNSSAIAAIDF